MNKILFNDDCVNVLKKLQSESVDLCLTDPPYGILTVKKEADYQNENRNFCDWDFEINYDEVLPQLKRIMKKDGNILLFAKSPFTFRLYEQMIKHGFTHRYNWIWKKQQSANFASMKYRPGSNYEEVMVFTPTPKRGKYFAHAEYNGKVKTKCKFYNYKTRTPIPTEEVFDKYLIPYILGNMFTDHINILTTNRGNNGTNPNAGYCGIHLKEILNEDIRISSAGKSAYSNTCKSGIKISELIDEDIRINSVGSNNYISLRSKHSGGESKLIDIFNNDIGIGRPKTANVLRGGHFELSNLFKEKYRDQFEIDFENKELYRIVKSYKNFPTSIIDIKYGSGDKKYKKHPTTKPVEVLEFLLNHYSEEGDTVLDFTMGSGSTGVACKNMNRDFIGCEISKVWFDVAMQRIKDEEE